MSLEDHTTICGLPRWVGIIRNDTAAFANDVLLATVNGFSAVFAFLSNLAIVVAVMKNPSLQKRSNIFLCSLAFPDCLSGIAAQPMFIAWRFFLQTAQQSCLHQLLVFNVYYALNALTVGLSFVNVVIISFDRHFALSRPLEYLALHKQGELLFPFSVIFDHHCPTKFESGKARQMLNANTIRKNQRGKRIESKLLLAFVRLGLRSRLSPLPTRL